MNRKRTLSALLVLALLLCLPLGGAYADKAKDSGDKPAAALSESGAPLKLDDYVINEAGETLYNDGDTVFNNFGTVYNNGGVVFNNGGIVYNNSGVVYNNGGIVYNNGALVYNNDGTVYNNDGSVEENSGAAAGSGQQGKPAAADAAVPTLTVGDEGPYTVTLSADYGAFADIDGLTEGKDGNYTLAEGAVCTITPHAGIRITDAKATAGACVMDDAGTVTLERVDRDGTLSLKFALEPPVISPAGDSYDEDRDITITAADGAEIYYSTDGSTPSARGQRYTAPFEIEDSCRIKAIAVMDGARTSETAEESYIYPEIRDIRFADAAVGYAQPKPVALVVRNTGLGDLVIESVKLAGEDSGCFTLSTEKGGTVASGQSDSRTWTVVPRKGLGAGKYEAEAVFTLSSGDTLDVDIDFQVTAGTAKGTDRA